jgi:hypothetical protein
MRKTGFVVLAMALLPCCALAVDGVVLINQSTVVSMGGFPFKITSGGSYRLSGNLTVPDANTTAISIGADNVTLDLNGFSITGPTVCTGFLVVSCSPSGTGIGIDGGSSANITVVNGLVRGMGHMGVSLGGNYCYLEKMSAVSNDGYGFNLTGYGTVNNSTANANGNTGFNTTHYMVTGNTAIFNAGYGISATLATVSGNTTYFNASGGMSVSCPSSIVNNTATGNFTANLTTGGSSCTIANNSAP